MSIFIAGLAFDSATLEAAKVGILSASVLCGSVGLGMLALLTVRRPFGPRTRAVRPEGGGLVHDAP